GIDETGRLLSLKSPTGTDADYSLYKVLRHWFHCPPKGRSNDGAKGGSYENRSFRGEFLAPASEWLQRRRWPHPEDRCCDVLFRLDRMRIGANLARQTTSPPVR